MKKLYNVILGVSFSILSFSVNAQSVGIGTDNPDPSAALEIQGLGQGLLIPKSDTTSVTYPATGLLVYQPTDGNFYYYSGSSWERISTSLNDAHDNLGDHSMTQNIITNGNWISGNTIGGGVYVDPNNFVGINNVSPSVSLDVSGKFRLADGNEGINKVMTTVDATGLGTWTDIVNIQDNLGNHIATNHLQMSGNWITNDTDKEGVFIAETGSVSIGSSALVPFNAPNTLGVAGRLSVGENYINQSAPPNGLIVEGNVAFGTPNPAVNGITLLTSGGTNPVGISQAVYAGGAALEFTTTDDNGKQASRIAIRGTTDAADITFQRGAAGAEVEMVHIEGTNGYVGIGTTTPSATLEVNGEFVVTSIAQIDELIVTQEILFSKKNLYTTGTSYISNIVAGSVDVDGVKVDTKSNTAGFKVTKISDGQYEVVFPIDAFTDIPVITVTAGADGGSDNRFAVILKKSAVGFTLGVKSASGNFNSGPFDFVAIGVR